MLDMEKTKGWVKKIEVMGLRKGERLDEKLFFEGENVITNLNEGFSRDADRMSSEDIMKMRLVLRLLIVMILAILQ